MATAITFADGTELSLPTTVLESIHAHMNRKGFQIESGGILLGTRSTVSPSFEITHASLPSRFDVAHKFSFIRKKDPANDKIRSAWANSGGTVNYLGEWHTHDESLPVPSTVDRQLINQVIKDKACSFDRVFMLILGNDGTAFIGVANPNESTGFYDSKYIDWCL